MNQEKINLYLDDKRDCPEGFTIARNMKEAIECFEKYDIQILSLDHDLGEDETGKLLPTGYDFVKYFCLHNLFAERIYIHTDNPPGRQAMYETLKGAQRRGFIAEDIKIHHYSITVNRYSGE